MGEVDRCCRHLSISFLLEGGKRRGFLVDYAGILVVSINLILFQYSRLRGSVILIAKEVTHAIDRLRFLALRVVQSYAVAGL